MAFNLIKESWIPVRLREGPRQYIPPWRVTDQRDGPIESLAFSRADLQGAAMIMLTGLLQTAFAPGSDRDWLRFLEQPPKPDELRERFESAAHAFNLDGDGPRFMQDQNCPPGKESLPVSFLLPDQPAGNTLKLNRAHFVKPELVDGMCPGCLAAGLYWRQTCMGGFGGGFRDGLRRKAPLTTMVQGRDLWQTLWLNVLPLGKHHRLIPEPHPTQDVARFPWLGPLKMSHKDETIFPEEVHPDHLYWYLPHSLIVDDQQVSNDQTCPLCGREGVKLYHFFHRRKHGPLYAKAGWRHPLTPHWFNEDNLPVFTQTPVGGVCYRDWLGLAMRDDDEKRLRRPAPIIEEYFQRLGRLDLWDRFGWEYRAWVFGLEMDQAKSRRLTSSLMPLITVPEEQREEFEESARQLVRCSYEAAKRLRGLVKDALFGKKAKVKFDGGALGLAYEAYWESTEPGFYDSLRALASALNSPQGTQNELVVQLKENWLAMMGRACLAIFDQLVDIEQNDKSNPKRKAQARNIMKRSVGPGTKKLRKLLELPETSAKKKAS